MRCTRTYLKMPKSRHNAELQTALMCNLREGTLYRIFVQTKSQRRELLTKESFALSRRHLADIIWILGQRTRRRNHEDLIFASENPNYPSIRLNMTTLSCDVIPSIVHEAISVRPSLKRWSDPRE